MKILTILLATLAFDTDPKQLFQPGEIAFDGYDLVSYYKKNLLKGMLL